jgi:hypothetical protein
MRRIVTAITVAALAFSLVAQATPASAAVANYDSSYAGESAFLNLEQGDDGSFTVFFANTGTTTWTRGSSTQVDLAACNEDKVTCNSQDASEAPFNNGWTSTTRYATTTQASVAPGSIGTFTYNVTVPDDAEAATYRFNGALVLASTGADIHNEGYFQDVTVAGGAPAEGAATITELDPETGSTEGGDEVTITGEDIVCTPEFPTVNFGDNEADVTSCGTTQVVVETPAGDEGDVDVTVTNSGAEASNALVFTYEDTTEPTFDSIAVEGQTITLTFSEGVCVDEGDGGDDEELETGGTAAVGEDITVRVNGDIADVDLDNDGAADADHEVCSDDATSETFTVTIDPADVEIAEGDTISVTIQTDGAEQIEDAAGNAMAGATTRSVEATADTTEPTAESAEVSGLNTITVTFSEPVFCDGGDPAEDFEFVNEDGDELTPTATNCPTTAATADTDIDLTFAAADDVGEGTTGELAYTAGTDDFEDLSGNTADDFDSLEVTTLEAAAPLIDDAALTASGAGGLSSTADSGDEITLTFSEDVADPTYANDATGTRIRVQDEDGTIAEILCDKANDGSAVSDTGAFIDAYCDLDADDDAILIIVIQDESGAADQVGAAELGDVPGLQWPATIIDTANLEDDEGNAPDLGNSDDVVIDDE